MMRDHVNRLKRDQTDVVSVCSHRSADALFAAALKHNLRPKRCEHETPTRIFPIFLPNLFFCILPCEAKSHR